MMLGAMAQAGKTSGGRVASSARTGRNAAEAGSKRATKAKAVETPAPTSSPTLAEIGREAQRKALLSELDRQDWNLTATAKVLGLVNASNVKRSLLTLGLEEEFNAAKAAGKINPGRPSE